MRFLSLFIFTALLGCATQQPQRDETAIQRRSDGWINAWQHCLADKISELDNPSTTVSELAIAVQHECKEQYVGYIEALQVNPRVEAGIMARRPEVTRDVATKIAVTLRANRK